MGYKNFSKIHEIDSLCGAFMFTRREAGDEVGWWSEDYFFNGEDIDFCYKLKNPDARLGPQKNKGHIWKIFYVPKFAILHYAGVSGGTKKHSQNITTADVETRRKVQKWRFDAMRIFYKKFYAKKYPKIINWLVFKGIDWKETKTLQELQKNISS